MGFTLNLAMFISFDLVTVALALLGFYTYPVIVAVVNVALGRETLDRSRVVALALAIAGMVAVVASQLDPAAGIRFDAIGFGLALGAALSQAVFVVISRTGYRTVPAAQAMTVVLATTVVCGVGARARDRCRGRARVPAPRSLDPAPARVHRAVRGGDPVDPVPDRDPAHRRDAGRDPDAVRAGRRGRPGRPAARRGGWRRSRSLGGLAVLGAALILQRSAAPGGRIVAAPAIEADEPGDPTGRRGHDRRGPGERGGPADRCRAAAASSWPRRIRVLIVDDHAMVRRGMRDFLDLHDDLEVVGEASDGDRRARGRRRRCSPTSS